MSPSRIPSLPKTRKKGKILKKRKIINYLKQPAKIKLRPSLEHGFPQRRPAGSGTHQSHTPRRHSKPNPSYNHGRSDWQDDNGTLHQPQSRHRIIFLQTPLVNAPPLPILGYEWLLLTLKLNNLLLSLLSLLLGDLSIGVRNENSNSPLVDLYKEILGFLAFSRFGLELLPWTSVRTRRGIFL